LTTGAIRSLGQGDSLSWIAFEGDALVDIGASPRSVVAENVQLVNDPSYSGNSFNSAGLFNGSSSFIELLGSSTMNLLPVTISVWIKAQGQFGSDVGLVTKYGIASANGFGLFASSDRIHAWYFGAQGRVFGANGGLRSQPILDGNWHHIAVVFDQAGGRLHIDGQLTDSLSWEGSAASCTTTIPVLVGEYRAEDLSERRLHFNGSMDDLRLYARALLDGEVKLLATKSGLNSNFWPNPAIEVDTNGDGRPDFWNLGGSEPLLDVWDTNQFASGSHSLAVFDTSNAGYGGWFSDFVAVAPGDRYLLSFKRRFCVDSGGMRVTARYVSSSNTFVSAVALPVSGCQSTWEQVTSLLTVPPGAAKLNLEIVSGGAVEVIGTNWIDDISLSTSNTVTLISTGAVWRYLDNGSDQGTNWIRRNFDDSSWRAGPAQLGYGDGDEATVVSFGPVSDDKYITTYFRHALAIQDASIFTSLNVRLLRDDGAVVYLNGVEVWRSNMPTNEAITYTTFAASTVGGADENTFFLFTTNAALLTDGFNVVTVEIHQRTNTISTDISFDLELTGNVNFPPSAGITSPTNESVFLAPGTIAVDAAASDPDGAIARVEFFSDGQKIGEATNSPYRFTWASVPVGTYALTAVATDDGAKQATSATVNVSVTRETLHSIITTGAVWKYLDNGSDQGTNWTRLDFNDGAWASGPAQLGYGDGDEATVVSFGNNSANKFVTTYFRRTVFIGDTSIFADLILRLVRDDGAIVYVNGVEVFRSNMPTGAVSYSTLAASIAGANAPEERRSYLIGLSPTVLRKGTNAIAVEVHQGRVTSSDISFDLELGITELTSGPFVYVNGNFDPLGNYLSTNTAEVRLETSFPDGTIFYSLDGSQPSTLYTGPLTINRTTPVRAIAYSSNFVQTSESGPVEITVLPAYSLSATTRGGGSVSVNQTNVFHLYGSTVDVTATPEDGWTFLGWLGDASGTNRTVSVTMTRQMCVQAVFGTSIGASVVGNGSVTVNPQTALYPYGFPLRLSAVPQSGSHFAFWGNAGSGTNNPLTHFVTEANAIVTAVFSALPAGQHALTIIPNGDGQVSANPSALRYVNGQSVTLTAVPGTGQTFEGWSGDASGTENPLPVTMDRSRVITATFSARPRFAILECAGQRDAEVFQATLTGDLGATYRIDGSADLEQWKAIATRTNVLGVVQFNEAFGTNEHRFLRAVRIP